MQAIPATPLGTRTSTSDPLAEVVQKMRGREIAYEDALRQFKESYISHILALHKAHLGRTAEELKMHRNTLSRTLTELDMDISEIRPQMRSKPRLALQAGSPRKRRRSSGSNSRSA